MQKASQENAEYHNASVRKQLERRNKDLDSALFEMKTSQRCNKLELEKCKQFYLEQLEGRKSLESELNK